MRITRELIYIYIVALALIFGLLLILEGEYFVGIALITCMLLILHRELWSLLTTRKLPPFDERIRDNIAKSIRNGFIFLVFAIAILMITGPFPTSVTSVFSRQPSSSITVHIQYHWYYILGYLLLSGSAVYMLSYIFYDRVEQKLGRRGLKTIKICSMTLGIFIAVSILGLVLVGIFTYLFLR